MRVTIKYRIANKKGDPRPLLAFIVPYIQAPYGVQSEVMTTDDKLNRRLLATGEETFEASQTCELKRRLS